MRNVPESVCIYFSLSLQAGLLHIVYKVYTNSITLQLPCCDKLQCYHTKKEKVLPSSVLMTSAIYISECFHRSGLNFAHCFLPSSGSGRPTGMYTLKHRQVWKSPPCISWTGREERQAGATVLFTGKAARHPGCLEGDEAEVATANNNRPSRTKGEALAGWVLFCQHETWLYFFLLTLRTQSETLAVLLLYVI